LDLDHALQSVMEVHSRIPEDGFTATSLGTERAGSGVLIRENGLVLTIGYLITEAETIWLKSVRGRTIPGHALAYDQETGFGLVQALSRLELPAMELGSSGETKLGDPVILAGGGPVRSVQSYIVGKQEFAGYWEYLLEEALFTAPAHPLWGGAALISADCKLLGVGSLLMRQMTPKGTAQDLNMVVPIDLLPPILDDLLAYGQVNKPPRPWLGVYSAETDGKIMVADVAEKGPAAAAGVREGDIVLGVRDLSVDSLADFYRKVWNCGPAGTEIPIEVVRDNRAIWLRIKSADRGSYLKKPRLH
jgi:S1-C subfamily serine protease